MKSWIFFSFCQVSFWVFFSNKPWRTLGGWPNMLQDHLHPLVHPLPWSFHRRFFYNFTFPQFSSFVPHVHLDRYKAPRCSTTSRVDSRSQKHQGALLSFGIMSLGLQEMSFLSLSLLFSCSVLFTVFFTSCECFVQIKCCSWV